MAYNVIANLQQYTTNYNVTNRCILQTMDNELMFCDNIELGDYTANTDIAELPETTMYPLYDLFIPCCVKQTFENLLENSEHFNPDNTPFTNSNVTATTTANTMYFDGERYYYVSQNNNRFIQVDFPALETGEEYFFSYEVARDGITTTLVNQQVITIGNNTFYGGKVDSGCWKKVTCKFTADANTTFAKLYLGFASQTTQNYAGYFRHFYLGKIEKEWFEGITEITTIEPLKISNQGIISLINDYTDATLFLDGITPQINDNYYNHTIGNVNVIPSTRYGII